MKNEKLKTPIPPSETVHLGYRVIARFPFQGSPDSDELRYPNNFFISNKSYDTVGCINIESVNF